MRREPLQVTTSDTPLAQVEAAVLAIPVSEPGRLSPAGVAIDVSLGGRLAHLIADGELKASVGSVTLVHTLGELVAHRVAAVGVGKDELLDTDALRTAAARVAGCAAGIGGGTIAWAIDDGVSLHLAEQARAVVEGTVLATYDPGAWKTHGERPDPLTRLVLCGPASASVEVAAANTSIVAGWTNRCRDLVDMPANELTPTRLAECAEEIGASLPHLGCEILGPKEIVGAGMGAFAAVAQASATEPRLIVFDYDPPGARDDMRLGLVGKAITFDTGGISLKPSGRMDEMKSDMAGGAAVLAGVAAIAALGLPLRVVAIVPATENMPGGRAYRPGDIVTALNGKTIEITNTDAEGRLVLADALVDARRRGATHILDMATLTGAVVVALGDFYAGLMGNDQDWLSQIQGAAEASGDHAWVLPLHETYARYIKSIYADMKNSSDLRQAGPIYAARFLQEFAGEGPWAHLDIAGTGYLERSRGDYYTAKGATGYGVRLIAALAERLVR